MNSSSPGKKKGWEIESIERVPKVIDDEVLDQILDEVTEIIYDYFCQQQRPTEYGYSSKQDLMEECS